MTQILICSNVESKGIFQFSDRISFPEILDPPLKASMQTKQFLSFNNNGIYYGDLVLVKCM